MWGRLLDAAGYGSVRVDVLAGASAGGLNGVLLAASLLHGVPFDRYRDVWLDVADLRQLLRSTKTRAPLSLLKGDAYFLSEMREQLGSLVEEAAPGEALHADYLDLHLSATLLDPVNVPVTTDWGERHAETSHRAAFRFRHTPVTSDFRAGGGPAAEDAGLVAKLALAARATSSFPAAFEPATVPVQRPKSVGRRAAPDDADDLFGLFSDASRTEQRVIDGGVLDNIPLAKAIDGIVASTAHGPTERWLLYLNPSPETPDDPARGGARDEPPNAVRTVMGTLAAKSSAESVLDDLDLLRAHNERALGYRVLRRALLAPVSGTATEALLSDTSARLERYWTERVDALARRIMQLLADPVAVLGEDPFTTPAQRWPLTAEGDEWGPAGRAALAAALGDELRAAVRTPDGAWPALAEVPLVLNPEPLPRLADFAIEATWHLERAGGDPEPLRQAKARLYAVAGAAKLLAHIGDLFWPVHAAAEPPDPVDVPGWATRAVSAWQAFLADPRAAAAGSLSVFDALAAELDRRMAAVEPAAVGNSGPTADPEPRPVLWQALVDAVAALGPLVTTAPREPQSEEARTALGLLRRVAHEPREAGSVLSAVEVLTSPLQSVARVPPQHVRYLRISGAQHSPLEDHVPEPLTAANKLAGNDLANFSAFYRRSWRANDWMWGRLDAAAALVELVCQPTALAAHFATADVPADADPVARAAAFADTVREIVCDPPASLEGDDAQRWTRDLTERVWAPREERILAEAETLFDPTAAERATLEATREALTCRRQWELLVDELPVVAEAVQAERRAEGGPARLPSLAERPRAPADVDALLAGYRIGGETFFGEAGTPQFTRTVADCVVLAWDALTAGLTPYGRLLRPVGRFLRLARLVARGSAGIRGWLRRRRARAEAG